MIFVKLSRRHRMDQRLETLVRIASTEFDGPSLMGPAFLSCVEAVPFEELTEDATYEGYSVWGVALHVLYHKWAAIKLAGGDAPRYSYEEADWPKLPTKPDKTAWTNLIQDLKTMQKAWLTALRKFPMSRWEEAIPEWGCTVGQVIDCIVLHDLYHAAMIRNMGLKSLKRNK